jgi:predicted nicotinamide N-methyase
LVERTVVLRGYRVRLLHPRDGLDLLDEDAFERDQFLPYWAQPWPSGLALARLVAAADSLAGMRTLELGCGLALPSIAAALAGARPLATDWSSDAVAFAATNAARNGVPVATAVCSWTEPAPLLAAAPWDLVLAADVLYEARNVAPLLELLPRLLAVGGEAWVADPGRRHAAAFLETAARSGTWRVRSLPDPREPGVAVHQMRRLR